MKKSFLLPLLVFLSFLLMASFCEKPDDRPDCEKGNYGDVKITNNSSDILVVDVTWNDVIINNEQTLPPGGFFTYLEVPAGDVRVWARPQLQLNGWVYDWIVTSSCETFDFKWVDK